MHDYLQEIVILHIYAQSLEQLHNLWGIHFCASILDSRGGVFDVCGPQWMIALSLSSFYLLVALKIF